MRELLCCWKTKSPSSPARAGASARSVARRLAEEGAKVVVHYRGSREPAEALAAEIGGIALGADLTDPLATEAMVADALSHFGRIDVLVNNAASFAADLTFETATWDDFRAEFEGVVGATVNPIKAVAPVMKAQGGGRIVNFLATLSSGPPRNTSSTPRPRAPCSA